MKIREYIDELVDAGHISLAQDIEDAADDLDMDTVTAGGDLRELLIRANGKVFCPLGF